MRHPFDGIITDSTVHDKPASPSRRQALHWIAGASAVPLAAHLLGDSAIAEEPATDAKSKPAEAYHLYFIVPLEFRTFSTRRRADLGIQGTQLPGLPAQEDLKEAKGYLAWLNQAESVAVAEAGDVKMAHRIAAADVAVQGVPPEKGPATLRVHAAPFQWNTKLPPDSYLDIEALGEAWSKQFSMHQGIKVVANKAVRTPFITFTDGKVPDAVMESIKEHPQVYALEWLTPVAPTTKRLGEEGGATTLRIGEEGGVTTQALGEEGGPRPSTRALGEEGGRPIPRPLPQPTTLALGEEGGQR